jgi:AraC-like DNA-binding protein
MTKNMVILIFLFLCFPVKIFPQNPENDSVIFQSSFESPAYLTHTPLAPDSESIRLVPSRDMDRWPLKGGRGIIQGHHPEFADTFVYRTRKNNVLRGVRGMMHPYPRFSDIRFGTMVPWTEHSPPIHPVRKGHTGLFAAQVRAPKGTYNAVTQYVPEQKDFWFSFYVSFSRALLDSLVPGQYAQCHELMDNTKYSGFVICGVMLHPRHKAPCFTFVFPYFDRVPDTVMVEQPVVAPDLYYGVEYHYRADGDQRPVFDGFINGGPVVPVRGAAGAMPNTLNRFRFHTNIEAPFWVDEVRLSRHRFGHIPPAPALTPASVTQIRDSLFFCAWPDPLAPIMSRQWRISLEDSWDCDLANSGARSAARECFALPVGHLGKAGLYYARQRQQSASGNWSGWSVPYAFQAAWDSAAVIAPPSPVRSVTISSREGGEDLAVINAGEWYWLNADVLPEAWDKIQYLEIFLQGRHYPSGSVWDLGGPFDASGNYFIRFNISAKGVWIKERPLVVSLSEYTGRAGVMVDGTGAGFHIDSARSRIGVKFRLLSKAEPGLWYVRTLVRPQESYGYQRHFMLSAGAPGGRGLPMAAIAAVIVLVLALAAAMLLMRRKEQRPQVPQQQLDILRNVNAYIRANIARNITVQDIANALKMGQSSLRKIYKTAAGKSLKTSMLEIRLEAARDMLAATGKAVSDVLFQVGFNDPSYFAKQFKKRFGSSPLEYRKKFAKIT